MQDSKCAWLPKVYFSFIYLPFQVAQLLQSKWELEQDGNGTGAVRIAPCVPVFIYGGCVTDVCVFLSVDVHRDASCLKQSFCNAEGQQGR